MSESPIGFTVLLDEEIEMADSANGESTTFTVPAGMTVFPPSAIITDSADDDELMFAFTNVAVQLFLRRDAAAGKWAARWLNNQGRTLTVRVVVVGIMV